MQTSGGKHLSAGRQESAAPADRRARAACALRALALAAAWGALFSQASPAWPAAAPPPDAAAAEARRPDVPGWLTPPPPPPPKAAPVPARPAQAAAAPRPLLISLRYGSPRETAASRSVTTNSRDTDGDEQHVQVLDGQRALVAVSESAPGRRHADPAGSAGASGSMIEVQPTLTGNTVLVRLLAQRQTAGPGGSSSGQHVETTLGMALGEWTEVSGRGPWAADPGRETSSSRDARNDARRVFIRIDELRR